VWRNYPLWLEIGKSLAGLGLCVQFVRIMEVVRIVCVLLDGRNGSEQSEARLLSTTVQWDFEIRLVYLVKSGFHSNMTESLILRSTYRLECICGCEISFDGRPVAYHKIYFMAHPFLIATSFLLSESIEESSKLPSQKR
jgi:hypothetical protein